MFFLFDSSSPRLSPFPSSDLGLLFSYPNKDLDLGFGFQSGTSARADGSVFVPRGGDAAGGMRAQVGPHSSIHVRVRVRVRSCSFRSEIGSFVRSFFSIKLAPIPMLDSRYSYSSDRNA